MLFEALTVATIVDATKILGAISFFGGLIIGVFKVINWIKTKLSSIDDECGSVKRIN